MKAAAFVVGLCLGSQLACADAARDQSKARAKPKIVDLDFSEEADRDAPPDQSPAVSGRHAWMFWALGATAVVGGVGWYWHEEQSKTPAVKRSEEVFTDEQP